MSEDSRTPDETPQDDEATEQPHPATPDDQDNGDANGDVAVEVDVTQDNNRAPEPEGADDGPERRADGDVGGDNSVE